ncbi:filamentous haemagglutinin family protein [Pandoraea apista]|uniref:filamentous haemagglutinin family protein n=1 Tax=Pandoraea apista TaxID=93218 RepID=UPI0035E40F8A
MTTFGGSIQAWSAQGDINAGRGAKTTVLYTPPRRVYDDSGNVTLSASVPSSGAGIATLAPLPEVPPGDVDLVAPLGTIDAGEAGVRVSGNVNFAALAVVNAANVQVQGKSTGLPVIAAVNVGALTNASATAAQAASAAQDAMARERVTQRQNLPSIFSVRMLSTGGRCDRRHSGQRHARGITRAGPAWLRSIEPSAIGWQWQSTRSASARATDR